MSFSLKSLFSNMGNVTHTTPLTVVGVDFGTSSLKVVEIQMREGVPTLGTYGELQLGPYAKGTLGSTTQLETTQKIEALVDVLRESKVTAGAGFFTLPLSSSFVTVFSLHAKEEEDIASRVTIEARKYVPVPMADVSLDWIELPPLNDAVEGVREVLIAAVQNTAQQDVMALKQAVKMTAQPTEIELFATLRAVQKTTDDTIAIIDLGAQTSKLYIAHGGMVRKIHRVFSGGMQATERIATAIGTSFEEAENRKRNYAHDDPNANDIKKAVVTTFERPFQEFKRVIDQYELRVGSPVPNIVITGGSASFFEMDTYASYMLQKNVTRVNAFSKLAYPAFMEDVLQEIAPTFTVAIGAALRSFE